PLRLHPAEGRFPSPRLRFAAVLRGMEACMGRHAPRPSTRPRRGECPEGAEFRRYMTARGDALGALLASGDWHPGDPVEVLRLLDGCGRELDDPDFDVVTVMQLARVVGTVTVEGASGVVLEPRKVYDDHADFDTLVVRAGLARFARRPLPGDD